MRIVATTASVPTTGPRIVPISAWKTTADLDRGRRRITRKMPDRATTARAAVQCRTTTHLVGTLDRMAIPPRVTTGSVAAMGPMATALTVEAKATAATNL